MAVNLLVARALELSWRTKMGDVRVRGGSSRGGDESGRRR